MPCRPEPRMISAWMLGSTDGCRMKLNRIWDCYWCALRIDDKEVCLPARPSGACRVDTASLQSLQWWKSSELTSRSVATQIADADWCGTFVRDGALQNVLHRVHGAVCLLHGSIQTLLSQQVRRCRELSSFAISNLASGWKRGQCQSSRGEGAAHASAPVVAGGDGGNAELERSARPLWQIAGDGRTTRAGSQHLPWVGAGASLSGSQPGGVHRCADRLRCVSITPGLVPGMADYIGACLRLQFARKGGGH